MALQYTFPVILLMFIKFTVFPPLWKTEECGRYRENHSLGDIVNSGNGSGVQTKCSNPIKVNVLGAVIFCAINVSDIYHPPPPPPSL